MKKRYEVRGMMEWHPEFKVGRTRLKVSFTGGHLCGGASTPAVFETSDPVVQAVIEASEHYRNNCIRLGVVVDGGDGGRLGSRPSTTVFEYTDKEDIFDFLHYEKGIPQSRLMAENSCFEEAERLGIELKEKEVRQ